jgi:RecB family endonuclease NucS
MQISEKDFEDWVERNIDVFLGEDPGHTKHVFRQYRLPRGGIIDLLAVRWGPTIYGLSFVVIELKADRIEDSAVTQILAYMGEMEQVAREISRHIERRTGEYVFANVRGILSAPEISNSAGLCVNAVADLSFVKLDLTISAKYWGIVSPGDQSKEKVHKAAGDIGDLILQQHRAAGPEPAKPGEPATQEASD